MSKSPLRRSVGLLSAVLWAAARLYFDFSDLYFDFSDRLVNLRHGVIDTSVEEEWPARQVDFEGRIKCQRSMIETNGQWRPAPDSYILTNDDV
jgi:hypothetical protein